MTDLTDDEFTVLGIAKEGQHLAPIGRWKAPIEALHAKGFLEKLDEVNFIIARAGRDAWTQRDADDDASLRRLLEVNNAVANARTQAQQSVEQAAIHLAYAAKASALVTGDSLEHAVARWIHDVKERALELVKNA